MGESVMRKIVGLGLVVLVGLSCQASPYYGSSLCGYPQYQCIKVERGQNWTNLFPNEQQRDLVQRLNRTYNTLWPGKQIVVPRRLAEASIYSLSPFPIEIEDKEKQIIVDQDKLAWVAYEDGHLVKWGPIASGRDKCPDSANSCRTMTGIFHFFSKENQNCRSDIYPIGKGGAKMPWCMYFHKGFALHGSDDIPGYRASHGCVRMFIQDAKWLNENFVVVSNDEKEIMGTKVTIRPVYMKSEKNHDEF